MVASVITQGDRCQLYNHYYSTWIDHSKSLPIYNKPYLKVTWLSSVRAGPDLAGGGPGAQLTWGH